MSAHFDVPTLYRLFECDESKGTLRFKPRSPSMFTEFGSAKGAETSSKKFNKSRVGKPALAGLCQGYYRGEVFGRSLFAHRVIWAMSHGSWPSEIIDHINGDGTDNRVANLRLASPSQNSANRKSSAGATSKYLGVSKDAKRGTWKALIYAGKKHRFLGRFDCEIEAARAYDKAAVEQYGEFANPNFPEDISTLEAAQ